MSSTVPSPSSETTDARHARKMQRKKAARDKILATKTEERGLLIVHTGKGKGKSTAAFGMVFRAITHGFRIGIVQFIKGAWNTGERDLLENYPDQVTIKAMGEGFTWEIQDRQRDISAAENAWAEACKMIGQPEYRMVLLDELNIALRYGYLDLVQVLDTLAERPGNQHVIITGRNAPEKLMEAADLVTEMKLIKHPFRSGVKAQAGIEF